MYKIISLLETFKVPFAYHHFAEGEAPDTPFICYYAWNSHHFLADGQIYHKFLEIHIELYSDEKSIELERNIESLFEQNQLIYSKQETWIESEHLYQILYIIETEEENDGWERE